MSSQENYQVETILDNHIANTTLEHINNHTFIHITVHSWKPSHIKFLRKEFDKFKKTFKMWNTGELFSYTKNLKFCKLMGPHTFIGYSPVLPEIGESLAIVKWKL